MTTCLNCNKELIYVDGRRKKKFCNNSCRVTYWQKTHAKSKIIITDTKELDEPIVTKTKTIVVYDNVVMAEKQGFDLSAPKGEAWTHVMPPERKEGESKFDYRVRIAEWHDQKNKK